MAEPNGHRDETVLRFEEPDRNLSPVIGGREACPQCGRLLEPFRCKLVCECSYFISCAEF